MAVVEVGGQELTLSNLDKVMYPGPGFTKADVIDYYARIAPVMLAHLGDRAITLRRFPDGVDGKSFFEKRCPSHRPDWVEVALGPGAGRGRTSATPLKTRAIAANSLTPIPSPSHRTPRTTPITGIR